MSELKRYFGTDGIRGKVGTFPITPDFVLKLGFAVGEVFRGKQSRVLIGKDPRISGYMFESALEAGLAAAGVDILLLGPMPTPAIAYLTRTFHAQAGIVISASHNPYQDNGIKFFNAAGKKLSDEMELAIEAALEKPLTVVASDQLGKAKRVDDAAGRYIEFCKSTFPSSKHLTGLKLVVDCAHGATYHIAPSVFRELGAEVIEIGCEPNGLNINHECGAVFPQALQQKVREVGASAGIALDGDGDRLIMVTHEGEILDGDDLLFILASHFRPTGVVGTQMSNLAIELALQQQGIDFVRAKVGDRYVMEALEQQQWTLGGESSGHIICRQFSETGDGIVAALQVLSVMLETEASLKMLKEKLAKFPQILINVRGEKMPVFSEVQAEIRATLYRIESALAGQGRVLLRPSGTEPVIRVMVEGRDEEKVASLAAELAQEVRQLMTLLEARGTT